VRRSLLEREFVRAWAQRPVESITRKQIDNVLQGIVQRGSPSAANHALAAVRGMLNWAVDRHYLKASPCQGVKPPSKLRSRDRVLAKDELVRVWLAADKMGWPYGFIVRLLILTGQRRSEVTGMRWAELDLVNRQWNIPAERTKAGRPHELPLVPAAVDLINKLPKVHSEYVFPARGSDNSVSGFSKWKDQLDSIAGIGEWRIHDLRRTVASGMAELKVPPHIIERVLNHTTGTLGGIAGIYNRFGYLDEMREALTRWTDSLANSLSSASPP